MCYTGPFRLLFERLNENVVTEVKEDVEKMDAKARDEDGIWLSRMKEKT